MNVVILDDFFRFRKMFTLITHTDLDGLGSVVLCNYYRIPLKDYILWDYSQIDINSLTKLKDIIITDLSIMESDYIKLKDKNVHIYDHHESSKYLSKYGQICDIKRCGTKIFFNEFIKKHEKYKENKDVERFVNLVDTYDRWLDDNPLWEDALQLNRLCISLPHKEFISLAPSIINRHFEYDSYEREIISKLENEENKLFEDAKKELKLFKDERNNTYGVFPCFKSQSLICNMILKTVEDMKYVIGYFPNGKISVRSKKCFDLTQLSKINGHKNAMGGFLNKKELNGLLQGIPIPYN